MLYALKVLGVYPSRTDIFYYPSPRRHLGILGDLLTEDSVVYMHQWGWDFIRKWRGFGEKIRYIEKNGFPSGILENALSEYKWNRLRCQLEIEPAITCEGEIIHIGDFHFVVLETPGHSPDHLCLYEPDRKILFSGDHILGSILPNLQGWEEYGSPLKDFLHSLKRTSMLDIYKILPAHGNKIVHHRRCVDELST